MAPFGDTMVHLALQVASSKGCPLSNCPFALA